jgi:dihydrofolate reductase
LEKGKIVLCIAASLDGYIADSRGKVDFLFEKKRVEPDDGYTRFYEGLDMILFGDAAFRQITGEISPGKWPYADKQCYVFSHHGAGELPGVHFTSREPREFAAEFCHGAGKTAWLFGGRRLIRSFMEEDLIDRYWIYILPLILGAGVPLFSPREARLPLRFRSLGKRDDMVKICYDRDR